MTQLSSPSLLPRHLRWLLGACLIFADAACSGSMTAERDVADASTVDAEPRGAERDVGLGRDPDDFGTADAGRDDTIGSDLGDAGASDGQNSADSGTMGSHPHCASWPNTGSCNQLPGCIPWQWMPPDVPLAGGATRFCTGPAYRYFHTEYGLWVGAQTCVGSEGPIGSGERYTLFLADAMDGPYYPIGDVEGHGQDHCELANPAFRIVDEHDIRSGGCHACDIEGGGQAVEGYLRASYREEFTYSTDWAAGLQTARWYECGAPIPCTP